MSAPEMAARITAARSNRRRCSTTEAIQKATRVEEIPIRITKSCNVLNPKPDICNPTEVHIMPQIQLMSQLNQGLGRGPWKELSHYTDNLASAAASVALGSSRPRVVGGELCQPGSSLWTMNPASA